MNILKITCGFFIPFIICSSNREKNDATARRTVLSSMSEGIISKPVSLNIFSGTTSKRCNGSVSSIKNIVPATDSFISLFNGKNLEGWHTYLKAFGANTDPGNNFRVEDGVVHVIGKDLGYFITDKGYTNFHFKVDFKWGDRRWPPRDTAKRDAGVCYNIPVNSPDSIWPTSIECQIQEGDVGDFWMLGFSTIKVDGKINVPSPHTRFIKKKDAEKPTGEWNTVEIISENGKCIHIVNGVIVNVGEEASVKDGKILLQSEYSEVYYKDMKIKKL